MSDSIFTARLWQYSGKAAWFFLTLPPELGEDIRAVTRLQRSGWGSVRVQASIGDVHWETSLFPDSASKSYLLPVKADVRRRAKLQVDDAVEVRLSLRDGV